MPSLALIRLLVDTKGDERLGFQKLFVRGPFTNDVNVRVFHIISGMRDFVAKKTQSSSSCQKCVVLGSKTKLVDL